MIQKLEGNISTLSSTLKKVEEDKESLLIQIAEEKNKSLTREASFNTMKDESTMISQKLS